MSYTDSLEHHLQRMVMADFGLTWEAVQLDDDGEICFLDEHDRVVICGIVHAEDAYWARVWVTAANGLKRSAKLLREVNELNGSLVGCRALLTHDGRLVIAFESLLEALERGVLRRHVAVLSEAAEGPGSLIRMMFGAPDVTPSQSEVEQ